MLYARFPILLSYISPQLGCEHAPGNHSSRFSVLGFCTHSSILQTAWERRNEQGCILTRGQWLRDSKEVVSSTGVTGVVVKRSKIVVA